MKKKNIVTLSCFLFVTFYFLTGYLMYWRGTMIQWVPEVTQWEMFKTLFQFVYIKNVLNNLLSALILCIIVMCFVIFIKTIIKVYKT